MKPGYHRLGDYLAPFGRLSLARVGRVVVQSLIYVSLLIVTREIGHDAVQMPLFEDKDVVKSLAAKHTDQAFDERVLPGRVRRDDDLLNAHALQPPPHFLAVDAVAVADQVARRRIERKCFLELPADPRRGRVLGVAKM